MIKLAIVTEEPIEYAYKDCEIRFFSSDEEVTVLTWSDYDAVFLLAPYSEQAVLSWTGHPCLRCVDSKEALLAETARHFSNIELERKFLIKMPRLSDLAQYHAYTSEIEQIYLECLNGTHRIRKRVFDGHAEYFETLKIRINGMKCKEFEQRIDAETYEELKKRAKKEKHPIIKTRTCFLYKSQYFELDIYDFWKDKATVELELSNEEQIAELPPELELIRDVTDDFRYKNNHLASIKYEDY